MKYEMLILSSKGSHPLLSNYAKNKKELKGNLDYFINELGYKLNDEDRYDNIQVSKRLRNGKWLILSSAEVYNEISKA